MTKPLRFSKTEIKNAATIALAHNVAVRLEADGSMLVIPDIHRAAGVDDAESGNGSSLQKWKDAKNAGKALGRSQG